MATLADDIRQLLDEAGGSTFWPVAHLYDAANHAQILTWASTKHDIIQVTFTVDINNDIVALPASILIPQMFTLNNKKYFPTTMAKLEQYNREWKATTQAQPKWFAIWDAHNVRIFPRSDALYEFELWGVRYPPTELAVGTEDITAPRLVKQAVAHRAAGLLLEATRPDLSDAMESEALMLERKYKQQLRNRGGHRIWFLRPESKFARGQSGVIEIGRQYS